MVDNRDQRFMQGFMRVALGQQTHQCAKIGKPMQRQRAAHQARRTQRRRLDRIGAEMLIESRPPDEEQRIAGLQEALKPYRPPAPDQAEMAAVAARQQFDDARRLAMLLDAKDNAFVAPFHRAPLTSSRRAARADHSRAGWAGHAASPAPRDPRLLAGRRAPSDR